MILGKKIGILGAAKSGISAAKLAIKMGYEVVLSDINKNKKIDNGLKKLLNIEFGCHSNLILDCDIIVISPGIPPNQPIIINAINKKIPIISEIEFASWFTKSKILTVTGSNGKSTTVSILSDIFSKSKYNSFLGGNIGTPFSENVLIEKNTKKSNLNVHILELSSFQIEGLDKFDSELGCILNLSEDHLDRYNGMNEYANAKVKLAEHCKLLYYDSSSEQLSSQLKTYTDAHPVISNKYFYIEENAVYIKKSKKILFNIDETRLIGQHNLINALSGINLSIIDDKKKSSNDFIDLIHDKYTLFLQIKNMIDTSKELEKIEKKISQMRDILTKIDVKLNNKSFIERAPSEIINQNISNKNKIENDILSLENLRSTLSN